MTYQEYEVWFLYYQKYGPLNPQRKYDRPAALVAWIVSKVFGGKAEMDHFMPVYQRQKQEDNDPKVIVSKLLEKGFKIGKRR